MRDFISQIRAPSAGSEEEGTAGYKSPNNALMAWCEHTPLAAAWAAVLPDAHSTAGSTAGLFWVQLASGFDTATAE